MRVILISTTRSGSHVKCSEFENPLYECLNIEDLILPRNENGIINKDILNEDILYAIKHNDWRTAWHNRPEFPENHFIKDYDDNLQPININQYPSLEDFLKKTEHRINCLRKIKSWCVKLMMYHGLDDDSVGELINISDTVIRLQRKNILQQCISQYLARYNDMWHSVSGDAGKIDYDKFELIVHGINEETKWINEKFSDIKCEYYEDQNFSTNTWVKNNVTLQYDENKCKEIIDYVQK